MRDTLEELQRAGLIWEDPYVQCRMQSTLAAMRTKTDVPRALCIPFAPEAILKQQSPEGFVRFAPPPPNEVFYPPFSKKNYPAPFFNSPREDTMQPNIQLTSSRHPQQSARNFEMLQEFLQPIRQPEIVESDFRNVIEAPRISYEPDYPDYQQLDNNYPKEASHFKERQEILDGETVNDLLEELAYPRTSFREVSQSHHIPQQHLFAPNEADYVESPEMIPQNDQGIYTEGGVVYSGQDMDSKEEARNILADMLGFTRHERLDVKKPGPIVVPPPNDQNKTQKVEKSSPKSKKLLRDDKAPYTVDTDYAHVRLKNP